MPVGTADRVWHRAGTLEALADCQADHLFESGPNSPSVYPAAMGAREEAQMADPHRAGKASHCLGV